MNRPAAEHQVIVVSCRLCGPSDVVATRELLRLLLGEWFPCPICGVDSDTRIVNDRRPCYVIETSCEDPNAC